MRSRKGLISVLSVALIGSCMGLSACGSPSRIGNIRRAPAPELKTLAGRNADMKNRWAITRSTNLRGLNDSLGRALYLDRPTRMQPGPIPY